MVNQETDKTGHIEQLVTYDFLVKAALPRVSLKSDTSSETAKSDQVNMKQSRVLV